MKYLLTAFLLFNSIYSFSQKITELTYTDPGETTKSQYAIIYGNFLPRLRSSSRCGAQQFIKIRNVDTQELFYFQTLPHFAGNKPHIFCCHLKPGTYEILQYHWGESFWYGDKFHAEQVLKNNGLDSLEYIKIKNQAVITDSTKLFRFKVLPGNLYYVGTWNFSKEVVTINNNKKQDDERAKKGFFILNFDAATTVLPE